jgi:hypothetical protein
VPAGLIAAEWDNDAPPPLYVDVDAAGANDGSSWADAFVNLQDALSLARTSPDVKQIRVAQGIYRPDRGDGITAGDQEVSFELINGTALLGGYAGFGEPDPDARDIKQYETILSGDLDGNDRQISNVADLYWSEEWSRAENSYRVVLAFRIHSATVFDGFTVTAGHLSGGMKNMVSSLTVSNCTFRANLARREMGGGEGGGMDNQISRPILTNCTFTANAAGSGGGMSNRSSYATLINCEFSGNWTSGIANQPGGGTANPSTTVAELINCTFSGHFGAGVDSTASRTSATLVNCTFSGDYAEFGDRAKLTNCIVWGNASSYAYIRTRDRSTTVITYSNVQHGWPGEGNIDDDPLFADPDGPDNILGTEDDDLRLSPISPCVDAGDPNYISELSETDLAGDPRLRYGCVDMGAYEFQGLIYVDNDAPADPHGGSSDPRYSDPLERGSEAHPMDSIQEAIDWARDGYTVLVGGGVYKEPIDFRGKAITVQSGPDIAILETPNDYAVSFYSGEGRKSVLQNFVLRNNYAGVFVSGSSPTMRNLTIVDNEYGITAYTWAQPDIRNCIFWNNSEADLFECEARYSCIEDGDPGEGNLYADPLFIDAENDDYHLLSAGWCWNTKTKAWTYDYVTSPCIDAGDPDLPLRDELLSVPRDPDNLYGLNLRINMGAYGGTAQASMPPLGWASWDADRSETGE